MDISAESDELQCTPRELWDVITDIKNSQNFLKEIQYLELVDPTPEQDYFDVGLKWRETRTVFGSTTTETMEITNVEKDKSYSVQSTSGPIQYDSTWTIVDKSKDSCILKYSFSARALTWTGAFWTVVMSWFYSSSLKRLLKKDINDIEEEVNSRYKK